ncbi:MAG: hypothetical protein K2L35_08495 [Muribaculaceae bacterium]|nr:hypothetical protein [Muribaculaceae bacterium]
MFIRYGCLPALIAGIPKVGWPQVSRRVWEYLQNYHKSRYPQNKTLKKFVIGKDMGGRQTKKTTCALSGLVGSLKKYQIIKYKNIFDAKPLSAAEALARIGRMRRSIISIFVRTRSKSGFSAGAVIRRVL